MYKKLTEKDPKEIIDDLHMYISRTGLVLKEEQRKVADEKMTLVLNDGLISELLEKQEKDNKKTNNNIDEKKSFEEIEFVLLKFYYAIYNDNIDLYRKFLNEKVSLGTSIYDNKIHLLNKELSDMFKNHREYFAALFKTVFWRYGSGCKRFIQTNAQQYSKQISWMYAGGF